MLAEHFLALYSEKNNVPAVGFSEEAILMLLTYSYRGNVRELENMIERAVLMARGRVIQNWGDSWMLIITTSYATLLPGVESTTFH